MRFVKLLNISLLLLIIAPELANGHALHFVEMQCVSINTLWPDQATACAEIKVEVEVTNTSGGEKNGEIKLTFEKSNEGYVSYLFSGDSRNNRLDVKETKIGGLARGEYNLIIRNAEGCTRQLKVTIN